MTNDSREQFVGERVRALATIVLTRRGDLSVVETKKDTGLDFHVYIAREDTPMRLMFGVLLRGVAAPVTTEHADKILGPTLGQFQGMRKFTDPVCLFDRAAIFEASERITAKAVLRDLIEIGFQPPENPNESDVT